MKHSFTMILLLSVSGIGVQAQISALGGTGIMITPAGITSSTNGSGKVYNVALGFYSLRNSTGTNNTAIGYMALMSNTTGVSNVAIGFNGLQSNTTGSDNTATGYKALENNLTASYSTANGFFALHSNKNMRNTALGLYALMDNSVGNSNTAAGMNAHIHSTEGYNNVALGSSTFFNTKKGTYNVALGTGAGTTNVDGDRNTFIGSLSDASGSSFNNATAIGYEAKVNASNKVRIGNTSVTVIEGQVAWTNPSDRRLKENIVYTSTLGLEFIKRLQTVSYNFITDATKTRHDGFIAQDIEATMKDLNLPFSGLKKADDGTYSLAYSDFVLPLVNTIKEQQQHLSAQKHEIALLKEQLAKINELEKKIALLASKNQQQNQ